jgi:hypothetical protein
VESARTNVGSTSWSPSLLCSAGQLSVCVDASNDSVAVLFRGKPQTGQTGIDTIPVPL